MRLAFAAAMSRTRAMRFTLFALSLISPLASQAEGDKAPSPSFTLVDAFPGQNVFRRPIYLEHTSTDPTHYYIVEQFGMVYRVPRDGSAEQRQPFLDWTHKTLHPENGGHNEEGLLGFAFDPAYAKNRFVYIYYSERVGRGKQRSVISRLTVEDNAAGPQAPREPELQLLTLAQPFPNHNGGTILFGPDGMLYVALGDGGAADDPFKNGQDLKALLGKVLRLDVRAASTEKPYAIPPDNPFAEKSDGVRGELVSSANRILYHVFTGESVSKSH